MRLIDVDALEKKYPDGKLSELLGRSVKAI